MFADGSQLHTSLDPNSPPSKLQIKTTLENTISDISKWMSIILETRQQLAKMEYNGISVADTCVRNLGVYIDNEMKIDWQVEHVIRVCYGKLREIESFRKYL